MTSPSMQVARDLLVVLDYGQFYLHTAEIDPDLIPDVVDVAIGPVGIAQQDGLVVVLSPHQNNFQMTLRVEVWDGAPASDIDEWQEAFEVHLDVDDYGVVYQSPTSDFVDLGVPPGAYHALITGRGFLAHGWPGSTKPGDHWRIRLWPSAGPSEPARLAEFVEEDDSLPEPDGTPGASVSAAVGPARAGTQVDTTPFDESGDAERRTAAAAAGRRIRLDLDRVQGAREPSGRFGVIRIDTVLPRDRTALWRLLAHLDITNMSAPNEAVVGNEFVMETYDAEVDGFVGSHGSIVCRWLELDRPGKVAMSWAWVSRFRATGHPSYDTTLTFALADVGSVPAQPQTRFVLTHAGIPREWLEDMTTIWFSKIDQWLYQSRPKRKRR